MPRSDNSLEKHAAKYWTVEAIAKRLTPPGTDDKILRVVEWMLRAALPSGVEMESMTPVNRICRIYSAEFELVNVAEALIKQNKVRCDRMLKAIIDGD